VLAFPVDIHSGRLLEPEWDVAEVLTDQAAANDRRIFTIDLADNDDNPARHFYWDDSPHSDGRDISLTYAHKVALAGGDSTTGELDDAYGQALVAWLHGDSSQEEDVSDATYKFRARATPLGDVVHSNPILVAKPDMGYEDAIASAPYSTFVANHANRMPVLYFGGNDGMLHAVSGRTTAQSQGETLQGGEELFAYIPATLISELEALTDPLYQHRYYVDGAPNVVDAFFDSSNSWHSVLIGGLGAGGKAIYALDVTDPASIASYTGGTVPPDFVLWEINDQTPGFEDLGYTYGKPLIFKTEGRGDDPIYGEWVAVFGNGYDSDSGRGAVYVVDVATGTLLSSDNTLTGGVGSVSAVDLNGNGKADLLYVADLGGNVWRYQTDRIGEFDLSNSSARSLLYSAKFADPQSGSVESQFITSRIVVGKHPISGVGRLVMFGTGRYYRDEDLSFDQVRLNTMYGIWDKDDRTTVPSVIDHSQSSVYLQRQYVEAETLVNGDQIYDVRIVSDEAIDWGTQRGWFLDVPDVGERIVSDPILRGGRLIFVTITPSEAICGVGGVSWLMEVDYANGGRFDNPVFDLTGDGIFDYNDYATVTDSDGSQTTVAPSGKRSDVGILQPPSILMAPGGRFEYKYSSGSAGGAIDVTTNNAAPYTEGRKSWWQLR
jgi:type IV pilus assembly protein PilY1